MNKAQGATVGSAARDLGFKGMWAGLGPRIIMIGTLTALQWFIYDGVKVIFCSSNAKWETELVLCIKTLFVLGCSSTSSSTSTTNARITKEEISCSASLKLEKNWFDFISQHLSNSIINVELQFEQATKYTMRRVVEFLFISSQVRAGDGFEFHHLRTYLPISHSNIHIPLDAD